MGNRTSKGSADDDIDDMEDKSNGKNVSYYTMIKQSYQALVHAIIRPPRSNYETSQLGPKSFEFCGKVFERKDFELRNSRGLKFICSHWEPSSVHRQNPVLPCVIYMHGNSSSRLESLSTLSLVLSLGATLLAVDFAGSGKSEGEYVSLGYYEKDDLQAVIEYLRSSGTTSTIALWGRSMGAATALLHGDRDPSIAGMVLDSAFADLVLLAEEMVEKGRQQGLFAPGILVKLAIKFVRSSVLKAANFDIRALSPIEHADRCFIPALFIAAEGDNFVNKSHSQKIYDRYGGDKNIIIVEGDHNTARPFFLFDSVSIFLINTLQIPDQWILEDGHNYIRKFPWTWRKKKIDDMYAVEADLSLDELLAITLMQQEGQQVGSEELGYLDSEDMQAEVQSTLYGLLGGGAAVPPPSSTVAAPPKSANSSAANSHSSETTIASSSSAMKSTASESTVMSGESGSAKLYATTYPKDEIAALLMKQSSQNVLDAGEEEEDGEEEGQSKKSAKERDRLSPIMEHEAAPTVLKYHPEVYARGKHSLSASNSFRHVFGGIDPHSMPVPDISRGDTVMEGDDINFLETEELQREISQYADEYQSTDRREPNSDIAFLANIKSSEKKSINSWKCPTCHFMNIGNRNDDECVACGAVHTDFY